MAEVIEIVKRHPITPDMPSMRCVGYRQVLEFLLASRHPACLENDALMAWQAAQNLANLPHDATKTATNAQNSPKNPEFDVQKACQEMKNKALYATRQLAKRQYTWLRQLSLLGVTSRANAPSLNLVSFDSITEVEKQLIKN